MQLRLDTSLVHRLIDYSAEKVLTGHALMMITRMMDIQEARPIA